LFKGHVNPYIDSEAIMPGEPLKDKVPQLVRNSELLLVVIGPKWNVKRLSNSNDYVTLELKTACENDKKVIFLIMPGGEMPKREDVPNELKMLFDGDPLAHHLALNGKRINDENLNNLLLSFPPSMRCWPIVKKDWRHFVIASLGTICALLFVHFVMFAGKPQSMESLL
jgi:hypothetical protein